MKKEIKQVVGIDVAQKELVVCFGRMYDDWTIEFPSNKVFPNSSKGFNLLLDWVKRIKTNGIPVGYVCEATGVYHESLVYFLDGLGDKISIVLPNKISSYMRTLDLKTITDRTASEAIARFGLERNLEAWHRPDAEYKKLKQLTRERNQLIVERTALKNQLHAEKAQAEPYKACVERLNKRPCLIGKKKK
jgi:transposase